jgi:C-terminal processing protease CtpA/Prc
MFSRLPRTLSALAAVAFCASAPLAAQDDNVRVFSYSSDRPRIGVMLQSRADKETDRLGAKIAEVTPDGPADKAGLKAGDIITRFNGIALGGVSGDDEDASGPAAKLVDLAGKLSKGDTVEVEYRRGTENGKLKLVAQTLPESSMRRYRVQVPDMQGMNGMPEMGQMHRMPFNGGPGMPMDPGEMGNVRIFMDHDDGGLNLTDLNPGLGEYFGAKSGVLVLETPKDSTIPLKAGDVIVSIDGRTPTSEAHARRILGSYEAGETAKVEVLRKQKKLTLSWKAPERERGWKMQHGPEKVRVKVERS